MTEIYLSDVRDWLKTIDLPVNEFYIGKLDAKKDKSLGIYPIRSSRPARKVIGGESNLTYKTKQISLLVHYNKNQKETEIAAFKIYDILNHQKPIKIGNAGINFIRMLVEEPVDVLMDEHGVYEYVIEFEINFNVRTEE